MCPDKLYINSDLILWIECDEHQHSQSGFKMKMKKWMKIQLFIS